MHLKERIFPEQIVLPHPESAAFFPEVVIDGFLAQEMLRRAGKNNLDYAIAYGSQITGDATSSSKIDVMVLVENAKQFHRDNLQLQAADYAQPHLAAWHAWLNKFCFNFYQTTLRDTNDQLRPVKLAVISTTNFMKGCSGTFISEDTHREGAFGMYVAGRVQKVALSPIYQRDNETTQAINSAINTARIDGVWFALSFLPTQFTLEELIQTYVSLSYKADVRFEKKGKVETLIANHHDDYVAMLMPILATFVQAGLVICENGLYQKVQSIPREFAELRIRELKEITFVLNYIKNPLTGAFLKGLSYAGAKVSRVARSYRKTQA